MALDLREVNLLALVGQDTKLRRRASTNGGEFKGPCPFCGGRDRFCVWPNHPSGRGRYWCRRCGKQGDAIQYLRDRDGLGFLQACRALGVAQDDDVKNTYYQRPQAPQRPAPRHAPIEAPGPKWQERAELFVAGCQEVLWSEAGAEALAWLRRRGLSKQSVQSAGLGFHGSETYGRRSAWGTEKDVFLPRGIVIPWRIDGKLWKVNIRRSRGEPKYIAVKGSQNALFNTDALSGRLPAVLVEGELDALLMQQEAGDLVAAAGTGSVTGSRRPRWIALLALAPMVLVSFDTDEAGETAADYWLSVLGNAKRWRPYWGDATEIAQSGADLRAWLLPALTQSGGDRGIGR